MKKGAGDDLLSSFDEETDEEDIDEAEGSVQRETESEAKSELETDDNQETSSSTVDPDIDDAGDNIQRSGGSGAADTADSGSQPETSTDEVPYLLRRNRVKEGRETVGFPLQKQTRTLEDKMLQEIRTELDVDSLPTTDLREAAYLAGLQNPEQTKEILLEWGYRHRR